MRTGPCPLPGKALSPGRAGPDSTAAVTRGMEPGMLDLGRPVANPTMGQMHHAQSRECDADRSVIAARA